jgi:hypothetical protein
MSIGFDVESERIIETESTLIPDSSLNDWKE